MKQISILLIEDNEGDVLLTREALENNNLIQDMKVMKNGELAISYLTELITDRDKEMPDLIFLDINLPKKNGHEVLQFIKQNEILKHLPVVMLTTSSSDYDIITSYKYQANSFIMKPVDIHSFIEVINKVIDYWGTIAQLPSQKKIK